MVAHLNIKDKFAMNLKNHSLARAHTNEEVGI